MSVDLLTNPWLFAGASGLGGAILTILVQRVLGKRGLLTYTVSHNRVGMSTDDDAFGSVKVTWNDKPVANLFLSTVELRNESLKDFENVTVRVWTTTTTLLTERSEIVGTTHVLAWTPEFAQQVAVPHGHEATQAQLDIVYGRRDYIVPILNRGQVIRISFLNAAKTADTPSLWLDVLHRGTKVKYRVAPNQFLGVPQPSAALAGTFIGILVLVLIVRTIHETWIAVTAAFVYGVAVLLPGAAIIRWWRWMRDAFGG